MDTLGDFFPRLLGFLRDDLAKEDLTSRAESNRIEFIRLTESAFQESIAKQINAKYDHPQGAAGDAGRQSRVLKGNLLPTPFSRSSVEAKGNDANNSATKRTDQRQNAMVNYESLPAYELPISDVYEEVALPKTSESSRDIIVTSRPLSNLCTYEDLSNFDLIPERIPEASNSDSGTDYEEFDIENEDDPSRDLSDATNGKSKTSNKVVRETVQVSLHSLRYFGSLFQKGAFNQNRRRFCGIRGVMFVCCKSESSLKVVLELSLTDYEVVHQEKRDVKANSCAHELRFSCPGRETHLFYADLKQDAENWVKELRKATATKQDIIEINADETKSLTDYNDNQSESSETNISGGSIDRISGSIASNQHHHLTDDARKKSKLQAFLGTVGKKIGSKTKNLLQHVTEFSTPQQMDGKTETGYLSIRSEEYTGDRWFKRYCRIEGGQLNCYADHVTDSRPEFSLGLRGAQLKPQREKDEELKITIVQHKMEHCIKLEDFLEHGKWLMLLIRETGFARQLVEASKQTTPTKDLTPHHDPNASIYEEPAQFYVLGDVTIDESCPDDEPPPLPVCSAPSSPFVSEIVLNVRNTDGGGGGRGGEEGIYLEPKEWILDLEEIKNKKKPQKNQNALKISPKEESLYINREFLATENRTSKEKVKDDRKAKSPMIASISFPNLVSVGSKEVENKRKSGEAVKKEEAISGKSIHRLTPSSTLVESLENLMTMKFSEMKVHREDERRDKLNTRLVDDAKVVNNTNTDTAQASTQEQKRESCKVKASQSYRDIVGFDISKINRGRRAGSLSSEDLSSSTGTCDHSGNSKQMVHNLVKMFERGT